MPRKPFETQPNSPYHLSARSNGRDWFSLPTQQVWEITCNYLHFIHHAFGVRIHSYVLMDNHFHIIASFPNANLSESMCYFMRETSKAIAKDSGRINHVYGTRIFRSNISNLRYYEHAYKYVYRNPVEAKIVNHVEAYEFSTLGGLLGRQKALIPLEDDTILFDTEGRCNHEELVWLNRAPDDNHKEVVRLALRRATFQLPKQKSSKRLHVLEDSRY